MDLAALILASLAVLVFVFRADALGLALLTGALICQFVHLTGIPMAVH